jgi:hypothetical protein
MATTKTSLFGDYPSALFEAFGTPIGNLRRQRKADCKPKKPKPVTDEQLLAIVDEFETKIKKLEAALANEIDTRGVNDTFAATFVAQNYRLKWFAPIKRIAGFNIRGV